MSDDELTTTQEELAEAKAELEELQVGTADREARSAHLESELAEALAELATAQDTARAPGLELAGVGERTPGREAEARGAAGRRPGWRACPCAATAPPAGGWARGPWVTCLSCAGTRPTARNGWTNSAADWRRTKRLLA